MGRWGFASSPLMTRTRRTACSASRPRWLSRSAPLAEASRRDVRHRLETGGGNLRDDIDLLAGTTRRRPPTGRVRDGTLDDRLAAVLGIDPAKARRHNFIKPEQMPYEVGIIFRDGRPVTYDSGDYSSSQAGRACGRPMTALRVRPCTG